MKRSLLLAAGLTAAISIPAVAQAFWWGGDKKADAPVAFKLNGAGATFPAPLYNSWFQSFAKETGNKVNYQAVGSGAGVQLQLHRLELFRFCQRIVACRKRF